MKEWVRVEEAIGRVTGQAIFAKVSSPCYNAAAMDGIAVRGEQLTKCSETQPQILDHQDFVYVNTGDPIQNPFNAVVMIEDVEELEEGGVLVRQSVSSWQHVRPAGQDIVVGELILPAYEEITPMAAGALLAGGQYEVPVIKKPVVGILPTGGEIISDVAMLTAGKIIDSNTTMCKGLIEAWGGEARCYEAIKDEPQLLQTAVRDALRECDLLLIGAGSSAGSKDYTKFIIELLGQVYVHGANIRPGKPVILGEVGDKPVIGIPGYPVAAYMVMETVVKDILHLFYNEVVEEGSGVEAILSKALVSSLKYDEFVRVKLGNVRGQYIATPLERGSGITMSLVHADGILQVPKDKEGLGAGEKVGVNLLRPLKKIDKTLISIGSHDVIIDHINDMLHKNRKGTRLSSTHVGSLGGLLAMRRGECHVAPIHLLDSESGHYNEPFINNFFNEGEVTLIKGVTRIQGLYVKKGNPREIKGLEDLMRSDIQYINRQKGAGTRLLLDYKLKELGIDSKTIKGYNRVMPTHTMVANAIKTESADVGMGIYSVAKLMDLDFIPIGEEEYDFLVDEVMMASPLIQDLIDTLKDINFRQRIESLGGYKIALYDE